MTESKYFMDGVNHTESTDNATKQRIMSQDGYVVGVGSELAVIQNTPAAMNVIIGSGEAWIRGVRYENTAAKTIAVDAAHGSLSRIDRITVKLDWSANTVEALYLKGTADASPAAPALTQSGSVWEIGICTILIPTGKTSILTADITDTRLTSSCGPSGCRIGFQHNNVDGTFDFGSKRAVSLTDPSGAQDADTKAARDAAIAAAVAVLPAYAPLASPTFSGDPKSVTPSSGDSDTSIATTAFVKAQKIFGSYTGDSAIGRTVTHGLGYKPTEILIYTNDSTTAAFATIVPTAVGTTNMLVFGSGGVTLVTDLTTPTTTVFYIPELLMNTNTFAYKFSVM